MMRWEFTKTMLWDLRRDFGICVGILGGPPQPVIWHFFVLRGGRPSSSRAMREGAGSPPDCQPGILHQRESLSPAQRGGCGSSRRLEITTSSSDTREVLHRSQYSLSCYAAPRLS
eukprot:578400-Pyramimonas_sp.AAC.1